MRQYIPVITLAAALALLLGVLLPSDNAVFAAAPGVRLQYWTQGASLKTRRRASTLAFPSRPLMDDEDGENNNDIEFGDTLTYSLSGTDAASFDIDASTGQLITKASLNFENHAWRNR